MTRIVSSSRPVTCATVRPHKMRRGCYVVLCTHVGGAVSTLYPSTRIRADVAALAASLVGGSL